MQAPEGSVSQVADTSDTVTDDGSGSSGEALRTVERAQRMSHEVIQTTKTSVQSDPRPLHIEPVSVGPEIIDIDSLESSACGDKDQEVAKQEITTCESQSDRDTPKLGIGVSPIAEIRSPALFDFNELERSMIENGDGESGDDSGPGMVDSSDDEPCET